MFSLCYKINNLRYCNLKIVGSLLYSSKTQDGGVGWYPCVVSALLFTGVYWILLSLHCPFGSPLYLGEHVK